ncbi:MAG: CarD family transcriptional regulator [Lachnospiraceae bacterium]|nr:CarD family transcriptional regulator [Lachnospiraceae bacterium]
MYQIGDFIVHEGSGICEVADIKEMALCGRGSEKEYYTLRPFYEKGSQVFTPVNSDKVKLRPVMTREKIENLIAEIPEIDGIWEENDKLRAVKYKEALATFKPEELVRVIKTVYLGKQKRVDAGKKILVGDEKYIQIAQKWLYEEIAFVMDMDMKSVEKMVVKELTK